MPQAITNNEQLAYIAETVWGTTPATPTGRIVRQTGVTATQDKGTTKSAETTNSREVADIVQVSGRGGLNINFELSYDTQFEDWLESLLCGAWATNVLKVGTTRKSFTFQRGFTDIARFHRFTGAICNAMNFAIGNGNIVTGSASFVSKFPSDAGTTVWTGTTAAGTNAVMDPITAVQLAQEGGAGSIAGLTEFSMALSNGIVDFPQLQSLDPLDLQPGAFGASGEFSLYFADATYWTKFAAHTTTSLTFTLGGAASKKYAFYFPKVKLTQVDVPNGGMNQAIVTKFSWEAFKDATDTMLRVTRTP